MISLRVGNANFAVSPRSDLSATPWYAGKIDIREYLKELNREKKVRTNCTAVRYGMLIRCALAKRSSSTPFSSRGCS